MQQYHPILLYCFDSQEIKACKLISFVTPMRAHCFLAAKAIETYSNKNVTNLYYNPPL